jgi:hypothetical protein
VCDPDLKASRAMGEATQKKGEGRGKPVDTKSVWLKAFDWINSVQSEKFAFGALFYNFLLENKVPLEMSIYEPEIYSGYRMMDDSYMTLRKSSYDLTPKTIKRC